MRRRYWWLRNRLLLHDPRAARGWAARCPAWRGLPRCRSLRSLHLPLLRGPKTRGGSPQGCWAPPQKKVPALPLCPHHLDSARPVPFSAGGLFPSPRRPPRASASGRCGRTPCASGAGRGRSPAGKTELGEPKRGRSAPQNPPPSNARSPCPPQGPPAWPARVPAAPGTPTSEAAELAVAATWPLRDLPMASRFISEPAFILLFPLQALSSCPTFSSSLGSALLLPAGTAGRCRARARPQLGSGAPAEPPRGVLPMGISKPSPAPFLSGSVRVRWAGEKSLLRAGAGGRRKAGGSTARHQTTQHPKAREHRGRLKPAGAKSRCFPNPPHPIQPLLTSLPGRGAAAGAGGQRGRGSPALPVRGSVQALLLTKEKPRKIGGRGASGGLAPSPQPHIGGLRALG